MSGREGRLVPIDEILNQVHEQLMRQWKRDATNMGTSSALKWIQDLVYYSMISSEIYDEIVIVACETIEE